MPQPAPGTVYLDPTGTPLLVAGATPSHVATIPVVLLSPATHGRVSAGALPDVRVRAPRMADRGWDDRPRASRVVPVTRRVFAEYRPVGIARPRPTL